MYVINEGNNGQGLSRKIVDAFMKGFSKVNEDMYWSEPYYHSDSFEIYCDDLQAYDVAFMGATTGSDYLDEKIAEIAKGEESYLINLYKDENGNCDEEMIHENLWYELGKVKFSVILQPTDTDLVWVYLEAEYGDNTSDNLYVEDFYLRDVDEFETAGSDIADKMNWIYEQNNQ